MNYCHITSGVVDNLITFDDDMPANWPDHDSFAQSDEAQIGWAYADGQFTAPVPPPPPAITADQVQTEAQRRFMAATANARALLQVLGTPIPADVVTLGQAILTAGSTIAAMSPIPQDFAADSRWPV